MERHTRTVLMMQRKTQHELAYLQWAGGKH